MNEERAAYNAGNQDLHKQIETIAGSLATDIVKQLYEPGESVAELAQRRVFSVAEDVIARYLKTVSKGE